MKIWAKKAFLTPLVIGRKEEIKQEIFETKLTWKDVAYISAIYAGACGGVVGIVAGGAIMHAGTVTHLVKEVCEL